MSILNDDINQLERFLDTGAHKLIITFTTVFVIGGVYLYVDPRIALLTFIPIPIIIYGSVRFTSTISKRYTRIREAIETLNANLANSITGILTVKSFNREIRILWSITEVDAREADLYFNSRPYESKISAWASDQSNTMKERSELLKKIEDFKKKYKDEKNVPRPPYWSGWCLRPSSIEFWLHRDNRIHERLRYNKTTNGWEKEILYP